VVEGAKIPPHRMVGLGAVSTGTAPGAEMVNGKTAHSGTL